MPHDDGHPSQPRDRDELSQEVGKKEQRKLKARRQDRSLWFGLGMFGLVGWSIAVPTLIGIAVGIWIDRTWHPPFSCTLICLFLGIVAGCAIAWYWIQRETGRE
jgi:ATP synthase protein I